MGFTKRGSLIKALQNGLPRGSPLDTKDLLKLGISNAMAHHYVKSGWLSHLGSGVFMFPNDTLVREACLNFLAKRIPALHVGAKTALAWRGVRHNLPARETLSLWGVGDARLPKWFVARFPARYTVRRLFSARFGESFGIKPLPESPKGPLVSVPERALLEMLSEVGIQQEIEEARQIMEGVRSLRMDTLKPLLRGCSQRKALLLCILWAEQLALPWAKAARSAVANKLGHARWITRLKDGRSLILKP